MCRSCCLKIYSPIEFYKELIKIVNSIDDLPKVLEVLKARKILLLFRHSPFHLFISSFSRCCLLQTILFKFHLAVGYTFVNCVFDFELYRHSSLFSFEFLFPFISLYIHIHIYCLYIYIYIYRVSQKKLCFTFLLISQPTLRETSRISRELAWQEVSGDMRLSPLPGSREN